MSLMGPPYAAPAVVPYIAANLSVIPPSLHHAFPSPHQRRHWAFAAVISKAGKIEPDFIREIRRNKLKITLLIKCTSHS